MSSVFTKFFFAVLLQEIEEGRIKLPEQMSYDYWSDDFVQEHLYKGSKQIDCDPIDLASDKVSIDISLDISYIVYADSDGAGQDLYDVEMEDCDIEVKLYDTIQDEWYTMDPENEEHQPLLNYLNTYMKA